MNAPQTHPMDETVLKYTTGEEQKIVRSLCSSIAQSESDASRFFSHFYDTARDVLREMPEDVRNFHDRISGDWHLLSPVYYVYPDAVTGSRNAESGTLRDAAKLIPHARSLGAGCAYLLPVFDSPGADGGFDVRSWNIRPSLGGEAAFSEFMSEAMSSDFPVIVDLPFNYVSIEHEWVRRLQEGEPGCAERFLPVPDDWVKTGEREKNGRTFAVYRDKNGRETERWIIFPHASRDHMIDVQTPEKRLRLYHTFYPFQIDVNLRNPDVFHEYLKVIGRLLCGGVLGFRLDAVHHWLKRDETTAEGLPETFDYVRLLSMFTKLIAPSTKLFPEVGASSREAARYLGKETSLKRAGRVTTHADGFWGFESRAAVPESVFRRSGDPFWSAVFATPADLPERSSVLTMVSHHDELPGQFLMERETTISGMLKAGGVPFRDNTSVSGRLAPLLDFNGARLTLAYVLMFLLPRSTPTLYYGEEAGLGNDEEYARAEARKRAQALASLGAGEWADSYDARDVHRQRVGLEELVAAAAKPHPVASAFRRLSALRSEVPAMGPCARVERVSSPYESVILMKRCAQSGSAVFGAINLSAKELEVGLGGLTVRKEALFESGGPFVRTISGGLSLAPESCLLTEIELPT